MTNKQRVLSISKELGLTHIGSNLSCLPVLEEIYAKKEPGDKVILSNGHAHLAHLVCMFKSDATVVRQIQMNGIHCDKEVCDASGGSLGHGIGIGIGYALADRKRDVYVIVSDGSMMEGSEWEALRIAESLRLKNLHIHCSFNGYTAVATTSPIELYARMLTFYGDVTLHETSNTKGFDGVEGHYKKL